MRYGFFPGPGMMSGFLFIPVILGGLFMLAIFTLTIIAIVKVLKHRHSGYRPNGNNFVDNSALSILNERYARGEIGDEEYQKKKAEIMKS